MPPQRRVLAFDQIRKERTKDMVIMVHVEHNIGKETLDAIQKLVETLGENNISAAKLKQLEDAGNTLEKEAKVIKDKIQPTQGDVR